MMRGILLVISLLSALVVAACSSGSTDQISDAGAVSESATAAVSAPAAENTPEKASPQAAAPVAETAVCSPGSSIEEQKAGRLPAQRLHLRPRQQPRRHRRSQKATLAAVANAQFQGNTKENLPRLPYGADVRDHRQGGLWVVVEFRGDELARR